MRTRATLLISVLCLVTTHSAASAQWLRMNPAPDADKPGGIGTDNSCWLATASNMLAGAGYGNGNTVQERADDIYKDLTDHYGVANGGWTDTALVWWLHSPNNTWWGSNPYTSVTVYGNKTKVPWVNTNGARFVANKLRLFDSVGLSISWPRTTADGDPYGGHAITCWGDSSSDSKLVDPDKMLLINPAQVTVADSDTDAGGDLQTYTYDSYSNPNPSRRNEGNGWYLNYSGNHPFIKHIVTLAPTDLIIDKDVTQVAEGSYRIRQYLTTAATDLHYTVSSNAPILSYKTSVDWPTSKAPTIKEASPRDSIYVDWAFDENPVPPFRWVTITTEFALPSHGSVSYDDVHFTYPEAGIILPTFDLQIETPVLEAPDKIENVTGGYIIVGFDLLRPNEKTGTEVVGQYRFVKQYDYTQDPENHVINLVGTEASTNAGYEVANMRVGHSYGYLDEEQLWQFNDWKTLANDPVPLSLDTPLEVAVDWTGTMTYPQGEIVPNHENLPCTVFKQSDLNQDCCVDMQDLAIVASEWLDCTKLK